MSMVPLIRQQIPIRMILCTDNQGGIGNKDGSIPWHKKDYENIVKTDLKSFKTLSYNSICIVGKDTFKTLLDLNSVSVFGGRYYKIMSKSQDILLPYANMGYQNTHSVKETIEACYEQFYLSNMMTSFQFGISIIGGRSLFEQVLRDPELKKNVDILWGVIDKDFKCDVSIDRELIEKLNENIEGTLISEHSEGTSYGMFLVRF